MPITKVKDIWDLISRKEVQTTASPNKKKREERFIHRRSKRTVSRRNRRAKKAYLASASQREALIAQALTTTDGRNALSEAMVAPIRRALDYQGVGRRLLFEPTTQQQLLASGQIGSIWNADVHISNVNPAQPSQGADIRPSS